MRRLYPACEYSVDASFSGDKTARKNENIVEESSYFSKRKEYLIFFGHRKKFTRVRTPTRKLVGSKNMEKCVDSRRTAYDVFHVTWVKSIKISGRLLLSTGTLRGFT